jgi:endonuclease YncB( thermonuclease family)
MKIVIYGARRELMPRPNELPPRGEAPGDYPRAVPRWRRKHWLEWVEWLVWAAALLGFVLIFRSASGQTASNTPGRAGGQSNTQNAPEPLGRPASPVPLALKRADTRVIDGDTIVQGGIHYRLYGIDAPELGQTCADGWPAGEKARGFLRLLVLDRQLVCDDHGTDKYGRTLSVCRLEGDDVNAIMVRTGNARAYSQYSRSYVLDEVEARQSRAGMWAHNCQAPWDYRHGGGTVGKSQR